MKKQSQNGPDIAGLLTKIQEQLAALDKKVDALMNTPQPGETRPVAKPSFPTPAHTHVQGAGRPEDPRKARPLFPATCAECKKSCELPFKPSGDRPVYCQECFSRRKTSRTLNVPGDQKSKVTLPASAVITASVDIPTTPIKEKKKPAAAKKPAARKKPAAKKKK